MITLITGLPGHGKTLYALSYIKAYSEKEQREVFYSGIKDLTLPWTEFKAEQWMTLPTGAIIVIDEAQFVFARKPNGSKLPDFYEQLAVHRHSGFDIFVITQHPTLLDNFVRQLAGRHLHIIRKFGLQRANVWEFQTTCSTPTLAASQKGAIQHKFSYPKEIYGYYKSAELHTVKRAIPMKIILACIFVVAAPLYAYYSFNKPKAQTENKPKPEQATQVQNAQAGVVKASYSNAMEDAKQYVYERTPRVEGLPYTAPRYDDVTKPVTAPLPASCLSSKTKCKCYSQQATVMDVPEQLCRDIVERGFFVDFKDAPDVQRSQAVLDRPDGLPLSGAQTRDVEPRFVASADGYGVLGRQGRGVRSPMYDEPSASNARQ
jgi:zona occludens toxin